VWLTSLQTTAEPENSCDADVGIPRGVVEPPPLEILQPRRVLCSLRWVGDPAVAGDWTGRSPEGPSDPITLSDSGTLAINAHFADVAYSK